MRERLRPPKPTQLKLRSAQNPESAGSDSWPISSVRVIRGRLRLTLQREWLLKATVAGGDEATLLLSTSRKQVIQLAEDLRRELQLPPDEHSVKE